MKEAIGRPYPKIILILFTLTSLAILIIGSTYGEVTALAASAAICQTSGCARSTYCGLGILILIIPILVCLYCSLQYFLLKAGLEAIQYNIHAMELLFLTFFPFLGTSLAFPFVTHFIFEPGYQTELRFLAYTLLKAGMLLINTFTLLGVLHFLFRLNWADTLKTSAIPLLLFGLLSISYFCDASPYLHYLSEPRTYQLAKYYWLD